MQPDPMLPGWIPPYSIQLGCVWIRLGGKDQLAGKLRRTRKDPWEGRSPGRAHPTDRLARVDRPREWKRLWTAPPLAVLMPWKDPSGRIPMAEVPVLKQQVGPWMLPVMAVMAVMAVPRGPRSQELPCGAVPQGVPSHRSLGPGWQGLWQGWVPRQVPRRVT